MYTNNLEMERKGNEGNEMERKGKREMKIISESQHLTGAEREA